MVIQFHYSKTLLGFLIRLFSLGRFNHVSIRLGNYVYEATSKGGVIKTLYTKWNNSTVAESIEVPLNNEEYQRAYIWLNKQVGKGYDYIGVISFLFALLPPRKGYFYCSEYAICAYAKAKGLINPEMQKISPSLIWYILKLVI